MKKQSEEKHYYLVQLNDSNTVMTTYKSYKTLKPCIMQMIWNIMKTNTLEDKTDKSNV